MYSQSVDQESISLDGDNDPKGEQDVDGAYKPTGSDDVRVLKRVILALACLLLFMFPSVHADELHSATWSGDVAASGHC